MGTFTKNILTLLFIILCLQQIACEINLRNLQVCNYICAVPSVKNYFIFKSAAKYAVLAAAITTNAGQTKITGTIGAGSTNDGTAVTQTCGTQHAADADVTQALLDGITAYNYLASQATGTWLTGTDLGGLTLAPGNYGFTSSAFLNAYPLILDARGNKDARWIFQIATTFITAVNSRVQVINGGSNFNVFWNVGTSATLKTNTVMVGNIVASASVSFGTYSSLSGRAIALNGSVTMLWNSISNLSCPANWGDY